MPRGENPRRDSRDSRRRQEAEQPQVQAVTVQPSVPDVLEEMQRQNPDDHTSSK